MIPENPEWPRLALEDAMRDHQPSLEESVGQVETILSVGELWELGVCEKAFAFSPHIAIFHFRIARLSKIHFL